MDIFGVDPKQKQIKKKKKAKLKPNFKTLGKDKYSTCRGWHRAERAYVSKGWDMNK